VSDQAEKVKTKPWHWPGEWVRDQSFYRDIATRTASGVLVGVIGYSFAVFMGYIQNPGVWNSVSAFIGSVAVTGGFGALVGFIAAVASGLVHRVTMTEREKEQWRAKRKARRRNREDIEESSLTSPRAK
jgi:NhaP-type Na+/H+ or K+/H+ antiporter